MWAVSALAGAIALVLRFTYRRLPEWVFPSLVGLGTVVVATTAALVPALETQWVFYVQLARNTAYFFSRRLLLAELGLLALAEGTGEGVAGSFPGTFGQWLTGMLGVGHDGRGDRRDARRARAAGGRAAAHRRDRRPHPAAQPARVRRAA